MTQTFFNYSKKVLVIDENYTDWLIDYSRRHNPIKESLMTGYFNQKSANLELIDIYKKNDFLSFYNLLLLVKHKTLKQKPFT